MARSLDSILQELDAGYNPQRQLINDKLNALPGQADAEIKGLEGQQTQAFDQITNGARARGIGFSGIPIQEQAQYTSSSFLPAVARVRSSANEVKSSLLGALNESNLDQRKTAMSVYQAELDRDERARLAAEAAAEQRRAAAAAASGGFDFGSLMGGGAPTAPGAPPKADPFAKVDKQGASNAIIGLLKTNDPARVQATIKAIQASAQRGNAYDKFKLEYLNSLQGNSAYGALIKKANAYKPAPAKPAPAANTFGSAPRGSIMTNMFGGGR